MVRSRGAALGQLLRWRGFQEGTAQADHQRQQAARMQAQRDATDAERAALDRQAQRRELLQRRTLDPQVMDEAAAIESRAWAASDSAAGVSVDAQRDADSARERYLRAREASRVVASRARRVESEATDRQEKAVFDEVAGLLATRRGRR